MTFSIVARCRRTGQLGVAALTAKPGVGKLVAHVRHDAGAVATQALPNPFLAYDGLPMLAQGHSPREVMTELLARDPGREVRQAGMVDRAGRAYAFTGDRTLDWSGHRIGDGYTVQGNRLVGPEPLDEIVRGFAASHEQDLAERLLRTIELGEDAGGDRHGARSATVTVIGQQPYPLWDLRVDDHDHPAKELRRLYDVFHEEMVSAIRKLPTRDDPMGAAAREVLGGQGR
ncbi:DUF1028 domain-containing protein [Micromonospora gifhornensis]|uniref:Pilus assembly protein n=1 Tax=Micromonospora gifhornensis TaxID=84594 RepID=A0ABQ4IM64_9ACTN|nr:DUF1028 domain-containing protein [Micromonospora gifhornensis]GIJ18994.1 pilus assembly protein [Micromonospora gifhornensis]